MPHFPSLIALLPTNLSRVGAVLCALLLALCNLSIREANAQVNPGNNTPPSAVEDNYSFSYGPVNVIAPGLLTNDSDADGDSFIAEKYSDPSSGIVTVNANGSFSYTPSVGFNGIDTFYYKLVDARGAISIGRCVLDIEPGANPVQPYPNPDIHISNSPSNYRGDNIYNSTGQGQTVSQILDTGATATYYFVVENDYTAAKRFVFIGNAGDSAWTVRYYDIGGTDITNLATGAGWQLPSDLIPGAKYLLKATVNPASSAANGASFTLNAIAQDTNGGSFLRDTAKAITTYQTSAAKADLSIKNASESVYTPDNIYNSDGQNQTKSQVTYAQNSVTYHFKIQNDGNGMGQFRLNASPSIPSASSTWSVRYWSSTTGGVEITDSITSTGWTTPPIGSGQSMIGRVEVVANDATPLGELLQIPIVAYNANTVLEDAIKCSTTKVTPPRVDLRIRQSSNSTFTPDNIYNLNGENQTVSVTTRTSTISYVVRVENDGQFPAKFTLNGPASTSSWTIRYFDAASGGNNITTSMTGAGWITPELSQAASRDLRIEVQPVAGTVEGTILDLPINAVFGGSAPHQDQVRASTKVLSELTSVYLSPSTVVGGNSVTGTLSLNDLAPTGGINVELTSDDPAVVVPPVVNILAGRSSQSFTITTKGVASSRVATISGSFAGVTKTAPLNINLASAYSFSVSPNSIVGGDSSTGTVTLDGKAPVGGTTITLSSNSASAILPTTVIVPEASNTVTFSITSIAVATNTSATLSATTGSVTKTVVLTVRQMPVVSSVTVSPSSVYGGNTSTGTVYLTSAAPTTGLTISLSASDPSVSVPDNIIIPSGATSKTFNITTTGVVADKTVSITATIGNTSKSASLLVQRAVPYSISASPYSIISGDPSTGTVTLNGKAPTNGFIVALSSNNPALTMPASVTVPEGLSSATFAIDTAEVAADTNVILSATASGVTKTRNVTLYSLIYAFSFSPASVAGNGVTSTGYINIRKSAPAGGFSITLSSANSVVTVPATVLIPQNASSVSFPVTTTSVNAVTQVTVTASKAPSSKSAVLTLNPLAPYSISVSPNSIVGGDGSTGTVTLTGKAPSGGTVVTLSSNNPSVTFPATITVPEDSNTTTFPITSAAVAANTSVTLTATAGGVSKTVVLTLRPMPIVNSVALSPTSVYGGNTSNGTVYLTSAAPTSGLVVQLASSDPSALVPATLTVPAGYSSASFSVPTSGVTINTSVTITAGSTDVSRSATLAVTPPIVSAISLAPTSVVAGDGSTGTITLNVKAAAGGFAVSLSSNSTAASVPPSVTVAEGATSATFPITSNAVTSDTSVTLTATGGGQARTAALTIQQLTLKSVSVYPASVVAGKQATGTVMLNGRAPAGGFVASLWTNNAAVSVPTSVKVPEGATFAIFPVASTAIAADTSVILSAGGGSTTKTVNLMLYMARAALWQAGEAIRCGGIRWPAPNAPIRAGTVGQISAFLATDFDQRDVRIFDGTGVIQSIQLLSDPCSYTWNTNGGSFVNNRNTGQSVQWLAPTTPGFYTLVLVVDDQNQANQPGHEAGTRGDAARSYNDEPQKYSVTVEVIP